HVKPVALLHTVPINGKRFVLARVRDHQRNQLFRKLEGAEIVGASQDDGRDSVSVGIGGDEMVSGSLACRIGAARVERGFFIERDSGGGAAINFVGADVDEL